MAAWSSPIISACTRCATCAGLAQAAVRRGARSAPRTPVTAWQQADGRHVLATPTGTVTADRVLFATNGYTPEGLSTRAGGPAAAGPVEHPVTRPLTAAEQAAQGWTRPALIADTRKLLFYIRLLRDGRLLFGARGGTDASPAAFARQRAWMERRLGEKFPAWRGVDDRLCLVGPGLPRQDLLPHLGWLDEGKRTLAAWAYHGGGVAFATMFGRAAAARLAGREPDPPLPDFLLTPPPPFPGAGLRRDGVAGGLSGLRPQGRVAVVTAHGRSRAAWPSAASACPRSRAVVEAAGRRFSGSTTRNSALSPSLRASPRGWP